MEAKNLISKTTISHIRQIQKAIRQNKLVLFVGAGVSMSCGAPSWNELVNALKEELDIPESENDYLKIPQLYKNLRKHKEYHERLREILQDGQLKYNKIHEALLELSPCHIITTNYDDLLEQAIVNRNENFYVIRKDEDLPYNHGEKFLIKMHGDFVADNIVLTENDYLDYSKNFPLIRSYVMSLFASKVVLFVGFSFSDINLKYMLRDVRNCLGEKMQPVYMLALSETNEHIGYYFDQNLIHTINISREQAIDTLKEQSIAIPKLESDDERSNTLLCQLQLVLNYNEYGNDALSLFLNFIKDVHEQFHYFGKYIKEIFPGGNIGGARIVLGELAIPEKYKSSVERIIARTKEGIQLRKKNIEDLKKLVLWLSTNGICRIKDPRIELKRYTDRITVKSNEYPLQSFVDLDIKKLSSQIEELNNKPVSYELEDLLYPFLLAKVGRYKEAYDLFRRLSIDMTRNNKPALAFICKYNMLALSGLVVNSNGFLDWEYWDKIRKEVSGLNLDAMAKSMDMNEVLRTVLTDLSNGKYLSDCYNEVDSRCREITEQRLSAERGGWAYNDNIHTVSVLSEEVFDFEYNNCLILSSFKQTKHIYVRIAEGMLDSLMTPSNAFGASKLQSLDAGTALKLIFTLEPREFAKILKVKVADNKIVFHESLETQMKKWLSNLSVASENKRNKQNVIRRKNVAEYLMNILLLLSYSDKEISLPEVYDVIEDYWDDADWMNCSAFLSRFIHQYEPTGEQAIMLLNKIIAMGAAWIEILKQSLGKLCDCAKKENKIVDGLLSIKQIDSCNDLEVLAYLCKVANKDVKGDLIGLIRNKIHSVAQLVMVELYSKERIITSDILDKVKDVVSVSGDNVLFPEEFVCAYLLKFKTEDKYDDEMKEDFQRVIENYDCYSFLKDPLNFEDYDAVQATWCCHVEKDVFVELMKINEIAHKFRIFVDEHPDILQLKRKFWEAI